MSWGFNFFFILFCCLEPGVDDVLPCCFHGPLGSFIHGGSILKGPRHTRGSHFQFPNSWRPKATFSVCKLELKLKFPGPVSRSDISLDLSVHTFTTRVSWFLYVSCENFSVWLWWKHFLSYYFVVVIVVIY